MRSRPGALSAVALALVMGQSAACNRKPKAPAVAAAPAPPVMVASAESLSAPQVTARLPPPQPIPPEAIPPENPAPEPPPPVVEPAPAPKTTRRPAQLPAGPAPAPPTPPPQAATPGPQLRPLFTPERERELRASIDRSIAAAQQFLARLKPSDKERLHSADRVRVFVQQAREASRRGDLNRARSLAERAELLAADLAKGAR